MLQINSVYNSVIFFQYRIGMKTKEAISKPYGTEYTVGSPAEVFCKANHSEWIFKTKRN